MSAPLLDDARFVALVKMLGRTGAEEFSIRYCDEEQPVAWIASARWGEVWQLSGALSPYHATFRLAESVLDGGHCRHCDRPTAIDDQPADAVLRGTEALICWYR